MALSWNEIRKRAIEFSQEWVEASRENSETQSFYNDFFNVFGISRRRIATFEEPVKKLGEKRGRIDLFWKGTLLIEQKSKGKDLESAYSQALDYFPNLKEEELPKYILVSDFQSFELYDLEGKKSHKFQLKDFPQKIHLFDFIAGYQKREFKDQDPVNIEASELMGKLYDQLKEGGYEEHPLEMFLVRLLFCLFADDTGIFEKDIFKDYIEQRTREDGSDLGSQLSFLFQILNTASEKRTKNLDEDLGRFPYVNGNLFAEILPMPSFDSGMRKSLIRCCYFDWGQISPAIFGSLFQSVMDKEKRRGMGAHYTSEKNIMKVIKPLFLDDLYREFENIGNNKKKLMEFHNKISRLNFFDPACGCGNFLILTYRELRELEIKILKLIYNSGTQEMYSDQLSKIDVDSMYGIEIEEFPARIAEVAMWLMDHQMNNKLSEAFGLYCARLPLKKAAKIIHGNALRLDWNEVLPKESCSYVLGNPPFVGKKEQSLEQKSDMDLIFNKVKGAGVLDYVCCWYMKAGEYTKGEKIKVAFVSTNSITQGEQVGILWNELFSRYKLSIHFAHRTFSWQSEARGKAHVHVVIIGFATYATDKKILFDYENPKSDSHALAVRNINPYLADAPDVIILSRQTPINDAPEISYGSMMIDKDRKDGDEAGLILTPEHRKALLDESPKLNSYIRRLYGGDEFLNSTERWCLWLVDAPPEIIRESALLRARIEGVRKFRENSKREQTRNLAATPTLFGEIRQPKQAYILIPKVSSEGRRYLPIGFVQPEIIASGSALIIPNAQIYHFGILSSAMHNVWMRYVAGRLESRLQYSNGIVYNNYPWPHNLTEKQKANIEEKAKQVLQAREEYPNSSLADLYDPLTMPPKLLKAHQVLDKAVDLAYRKQTFENDRSRIEFLFSFYKTYTEPLFKDEGKKKRRAASLKEISL